MKRDPAEIVHLLTEELRQMEPGEEASINELATKTNLHWVTVDRYLSMLSFVYQYMPRVEVVQAGRSKAVRVTQNPLAGVLDPTRRLLVRLYRRKAVTPDTAIPASETELKAASALADAGQLKLSDGNRLWLTRAGLLAAADAFGHASHEFDAAIQPSFDPDEEEMKAPTTKEMLQELSTRQQTMEALHMIVVSSPEFTAWLTAARSPGTLRIPAPDVDILVDQSQPAGWRKRLASIAPLTNSA